MKSVLADVVQTWTAQIISPAGYLLDGTIGDEDVADPSRNGIFSVSFSPTIAADDLKLQLFLNGMAVDAQAVYHTSVLQVVPAPATSAATSNYTILASEDQAQLQYIDKDESISYTYRTGEFCKVLIDARDEFSNLRYDSEDDTFQVKLTGQSTAVVVEGEAQPLNNGSYYIELMFEKAESYTLEVMLGVNTDIVESPLENKILVKPGTVQAAYTHLETSLSTLTAGELNTF